MMKHLKPAAFLWVLLVVGTAAAAVLDTSPPEQPGNVQLVGIQRKQMTLSWVAPKEDSSIVIIVDPFVNANAAGPLPQPSPSPSPSLPCSSYDIRYSLSPINSGNWAAATQVTDEPPPAAPLTPQTCTVTGLTPNTTYYVGIIAYDEANNGSTLVTRSATTPADMDPPKMITGLVVVSQIDNGVTLAWTAPADDDDSKVAAYDLRYALGSIDASTWAAATPVAGEPDPKAPGAAETMDLGDLDGGQYAFAIVALDAAGNPGPVSAAAVVTLTGRISSPDDRLSPCGLSAAGASSVVILIGIAILFRR